MSILIDRMIESDLLGGLLSMQTFNMREKALC